MENKIHLENIYKQYQNKVVINNLNLELEGPLILGLAGPNNSGKSVILKILAGMIKVDKGTVSIFSNSPGKTTKSFTSYMTDKNILKFLKNIPSAMNFYEYFFEDFSRDKCDKILDYFSIDKNMSLQYLSMDLVSKISLALVLSRNSRLYLLDSPIKGVDSISKSAIISCIKENINHDSIVIISTLSVEEYEDVFTHLAIMNKGTILTFNKVEELINVNYASLLEYYNYILGGDYFD